MKKCEEEEPSHRTWSHPGLLCPPENKNSSMGWQSTAHDQYRPPKRPVSEVGQRRKLLEEFYWKELVQEAWDEWVQPAPVEEYVTEYDGNFGDTEFKPQIENIEKDSDLHRKYPLYSDYPRSFWLEKRAANQLTGATRVVDPTHPYRKNGQFSKPLNEILDEPHNGL